VPCKNIEVVFFEIQGLTEADRIVCRVVERNEARLDATLGYQNIANVVQRKQMTYVSR
jgi:hypothetical protein